MKAENYNFDFTIPQGPTGPTGPTGPQGNPGSSGFTTYGSRYNAIADIISLQALAPTNANLSNTTTANNVGYNNYDISILQDGDYEITYTLTINSQNDAEITTTVHKNNVGILSANNTQFLKAQIPATFVGNFISTLTKGDTIGLYISSKSNTDINLGNNASLMIKKLN